MTFRPSKSPLVSVVLPTCNRLDMLGEAIQSILDQTLGDFEVLLVNDGGDDVLPLASSFKDDRIRHFRHPSKRGPSAARNTALWHSRGRYIAYLDDDDIFLPHHLETLVNHLQQTGCKIAYTDAYRARQVLQNGRYVITARDVPYSQNFDRDLILVGNFVPLLCFLHERVLLAETGGFDESLPSLEDWELWIRVSRAYLPIHIEKITCEYRARDQAPSQFAAKGQKLLAGTDMIYKKHERLVLDKPLLRAWQAQQRAAEVRKFKDAEGR